MHEPELFVAGVSCVEYLSAMKPLSKSVTKSTTRKNIHKVNHGEEDAKVDPVRGKSTLSRSNDKLHSIKKDTNRKGSQCKPDRVHKRKAKV